MPMSEAFFATDKAHFLRRELMLKELGNIGLFVNLKAEH
jgi:hypothetical protein